MDIKECNTSSQEFVPATDESELHNYNRKHEIKSNNYNEEKQAHNLQENIILENENNCQNEKTSNTKICEDSFSYGYNCPSSAGQHKLDTPVHTNVTEYQDNEGLDKKEIMECKHVSDIASQQGEIKSEDRYTQFFTMIISFLNHSS